MLMELLPVGSAAGRIASCADVSPSSSSYSSSSIFGVLQPRWCSERSRVAAASGSVAAVVSIRSSSDPRRSVFGRRSTTARPHLPRMQAAKQTFSSFDDMIEKCDVPVLVDFYATWCGPCQLMVPILGEVSGALKDKIRVVKIDTEKYPNLATRFNVYALPTLVLFENGKEIDRIEGALKADDLIGRIQQVISASGAKK